MVLLSLENISEVGNGAGPCEHVVRHWYNTRVTDVPVWPTGDLFLQVAIGDLAPTICATVHPPAVERNLCAGGIYFFQTGFGEL